MADSMDFLSININFLICALGIFGNKINLPGAETMRFRHRAKNHENEIW